MLSMKSLFIVPLVLMSLISYPSWGLTYDDLVQRAGLYYEKFTATPFTGKIEGQYSGSFKNGKIEGFWERYWENGQLMYKGDYKNGKWEGFWEMYTVDGTVNEHFTGTYKNGVKVSD